MPGYLFEKKIEVPLSGYVGVYRGVERNGNYYCIFGFRAWG